jgi:CheY-like chemotaxis protein
MLGKGTTMTIRLPVCDDVGGETPGTGEPTKPMRPLNVLVVDDDPGVRDIVHRYLAGDGHRVTAVDCGAEAVREFQSGEFDLLVTDQGMPGMSGVQLARYIRRMRANQPIILLTGFSFDSDRLPPEIDQVLRKPIAPDRLRLAMVQSVRKN